MESLHAATGVGLASHFENGITDVNMSTGTLLKVENIDQ
jgi:hypothetical protein